MGKRGPKPTYVGCSVEGCEGKKHYGLTFCKTHYQRFNRTGSVELLEREKQTTCNRCDERYWSSGFCKKHYSTWYLEEAWREAPVDPDSYRAISYTMAHFNCQRVYGPARYYACTAIGCDQHARDWALIHEAETVTNEHEQTYSVSVLDYTPMCVNCHRNYDSINSVIYKRELRLVDNPLPAARGLAGFRPGPEVYENAINDVKDGLTLFDIDSKYDIAPSTMSRAFRRTVGMTIQEWKYMQKESVAA